MVKANPQPAAFPDNTWERMRQEVHPNEGVGDFCLGF